MNLAFSAAEEAFRQEVRAFLAANVDGRMREMVRTGMRPESAEIQAWQRRMHAQGWSAPT